VNPGGGQRERSKEARTYRRVSEKDVYSNGGARDGNVKGSTSLGEEGRKRSQRGIREDGNDRTIKYEKTWRKERAIGESTRRDRGRGALNTRNRRV